ncbi:hypothetical protein QIL09_gp1 [ssRNA phage SRR7976325_16]|uniref:Uncharacterized protein n=1 Tax=ssRNA phage SRR7976325_16 TaxID=2786703 RepID=A0A8S5L5I1_9VIRU|nr:hypothetical protein QIL09_gp1 [ssRNA phage SRR7976325_16]DAD52756.1 TPA_asm: hypothetical protein [ssRNA phage SRR7976325_16]
MRSELSLNNRAEQYSYFQQTYGPLGWSLLFWMESCQNSGIDYEALLADLSHYFSSQSEEATEDE